MTNELEKQFFQRFGIEPKYEDGTCDMDDKCRYTDCNTCQRINKFNYPQITDRILLELICFIEQIDLGRYGEYEYFCKFNYEDLRTEILAKSIRLAHKKAHSEVNGQLFYNQVRTLFEE